MRYQEHSVAPVRSRKLLFLSPMEAVPVVAAIGTVVVRTVQQAGATTPSREGRVLRPASITGFRALEIVLTASLVLHEVVIQIKAGSNHLPNPPQIQEVLQYK